MVIAYVIEYIPFFGEDVNNFISLHKFSGVEIYIKNTLIFTTDENVNFNDTFDVEFSEDFMVKVKINYINEDGTIFISVFISGTIVSILTSLILYLFNRSRVREKMKSNFKSRFIADMSHEIRTPMNGIIGMSELMSSITSDNTALFYLNNIKSCSMTLMNIINDILDMSKIDSGLICIKPENVNMCNKIKSTILNIWVTSKIQPNISSKNLTVKFIIYEGVPMCIRIDSIRVQQIVSNLFNNSIKFTSHGFINISLSASKIKEHDMICIKVEDSGCGIKNSELNNIFKPFKRISNIGVSGTGLGLSICEKLCSIMGGSITCESKINVGSTFTVFLPFTCSPDVSLLKNNTIILKGDEIEYEQSTKSEQELSLSTLKPYHICNKPKILIVDDVFTNRILLVRIMEKFGIDTFTSENGLDAVTKCEMTKFSLIFMDMVMPVMNGVDATINIRKNKLNKETPIIFVSANVQSGAIDICEKSGGNGFLTKPVTIINVIETMVSNLSIEEKEWCRRNIHLDSIL